MGADCLQFLLLILLVGVDKVYYLPNWKLPAPREIGILQHMGRNHQKWYELREPPGTSCQSYWTSLHCWLISKDKSKTAHTEQTPGSM